jgi:hypothetical protein
MHKGIVAYIAVIIIIAVIWYFTLGGFKFPSPSHSTTTSIAQNTPTTTATTTVPMYTTPCDQVGIFNSTAYNTMIATTCKFTGGIVGFWVASGGAQYESATVKSNTTTYVNQSSQYSCPVLYSNFTAPLNTSLMISLFIGPKSTATKPCGEALAKINATAVAPKSEIYTDVYNGNFLTGTYTGWTQAGKGFNVTPLNITWADMPSHNCYIGIPWNNTNFTYFATTFGCGTATAPGNLTSSLFMANASFLNFRLISPENGGLYIAILNQSNSTVIAAHYDTFNVSSEGYSTFQNASLPLTSVYGQPIRIRIVSVPFGNNLSHLYIAASGFGLSDKPHSTKGILLNET